MPSSRIQSSLNARSPLRRSTIAAISLLSQRSTNCARIEARTWSCPAVALLMTSLTLATSVPSSNIQTSERLRSPFIAFTPRYISSLSKLDTASFWYSAELSTVATSGGLSVPISVIASFSLSSSSSFLSWSSGAAGAAGCRATCSPARSAAVSRFPWAAAKLRASA